VRVPFAAVALIGQDVPAPSDRLYAYAGKKASAVTTITNTGGIAEQILVLGVVTGRFRWAPILLSYYMTPQQYALPTGKGQVTIASPSLAPGQIATVTWVMQDKFPTLIPSDMPGMDVWWFAAARSALRWPDQPFHAIIDAIAQAQRLSDIAGIAKDIGVQQFVAHERVFLIPPLEE